MAKARFSRFMAPLTSACSVQPQAQLNRPRFLRLALSRSSQTHLTNAEAVTGFHEVLGCGVQKLLYLPSFFASPSTLKPSW